MTTTTDPLPPGAANTPVGDLLDLCVALEQEITRLRADAEAYRWIRSSDALRREKTLLQLFWYHRDEGFDQALAQLRAAESVDAPTA